MHCVAHGAAELVIIDGVCAVFTFEHIDKVDRAEVARLIRKQGLLAAGIGAFDLALRRHDVVAVEPIQKNNAGFAVAPCAFHNFVKDLARVELADCLLCLDDKFRTLPC